ncbi:MAG: glycosyltransferase involved in cell wall biosynthesis [Salibacteraceae bacterium]|jgi:glycosyltransferase involved in cell wall biosynthesis
MNKFKTIIFILRFYFLYTIVRIATLYFKYFKKKKKAKKNTVLFLEVFTIDGAGYNYRVKKWMDLLSLNSFKLEAFVLIKDSNDFFELTADKNLPNFVVKSGYKRFFQILKTRNYETVIVRRSIVLYNDYGNLFMEKLLFSIHPNIILDFDDDIATNRNSQANSRSRFEKLMLDNANHFNESLKYYSRFIVGSDYLKTLVKERFSEVKNEQICVIPTCVDYDQYPPKKYTSNINTVKFGWIGGNQNLDLLKKIIPALNEVSKSHSVELVVIAGVDDYDFGAIFPVTFHRYDLSTEIDHLKTFDVGLMPLNDAPVSRGKCGFKLIQYMGLGIPSIASAITVNNEIIDDGINGWLVYDETKWLEKLEEVITRTADFNTFGERAKLKIDSKYSFEANLQEYLSFLSIKVK